MKIFLDTSDGEAIRKAADTGLLDGVTTNPSHIAKTRRKFQDVVKEICGIVKGPVSVETLAKTTEAMVREAEDLTRLGPNIVVKIPMTIEGLKAVPILEREKKIQTNVTMIFSPTQAFLAMKAGARFVSIVLSRLDAVGHESEVLVQDAAAIRDNYTFESEIIAGSVKTQNHLLACLRAGIDIATIPPELFFQMFQHPLTEAGLAQFAKDWRKVPQQSMKKTVVAFGEILWDILPSCVTLGGAPFNFAYRVNSLGDAGLMASRLGRDELGRQAFEKIVSLGLQTRLLQWDEEAPTGTVQVSFDAQNSPDYVIVPNVAYDRIALTDLLADAVARADCLCFGTLAQRAPTSAATLAALLEKAAGALKLLDINLRRDCHTPDSVTFSLGHADVVKLNEDEAHALGRTLGLRHDTLRGFCEDIVQEWGIEFCLVTLGENGAFGYAGDGRETYAPGYQIELVDSLGAGDAFAAGFVHKTLRGASLQEAVAFGNILGAMVAAQTGGTTPITPDEVDRFRHQKMKRIIHPEFHKS